MPIIKRKEIIEVIVDDIVYGGNGIVKYKNNTIENFIIFVKNGIEGQKLRVEITKVKPNYAESKIIEVIKKSKYQNKINYQKISGAPYIELSTSYQINKKKSIVIDTFNKIPEIKKVENYLDEFIESPSQWHYRNKMEYAFSSITYDQKRKKDIDGFGLGFKKENTWWMVENLDKDSGLFDEKWENSLYKIRDYCVQTELPAWNIPQKKGFYRNLNVRKSFKDNKLLVELVTSSLYSQNFNMQNFCEYVISIHKDRIGGIIHTINDNISDKIDYNKVQSKLYYGESVINESILGLNFEISMSSFFQTNPKCAEKLYNKVVEYTLDKYTIQEQNSIILDLFCGTGTIAQLLASRIDTAKVIGVDIVQSSIKNAKNNAIKNNIDNVEFQALDIKDFLIKNPLLKDKINIIIIDPPRSGVSKKSIKRIISLNAKTIIYVSCNPSTQSRDISLFINAGYTLNQFSIVDQFPHTHHIETIFVLIKQDISYL